MTILDQCKLTYFGIPGRGESIRLALALGGVDFTDERIAFQQWPALKASTPWGSLPMLTLSDGEVFSQQRALLRMVGKETGLYPVEDTKRAALIDGLMDACEDLGQKINSQGQGLAKAEKEAARAQAVAKGGPIYGILEKIEAFVGKHGDSSDGGGYAVGSSLTIADLFLFSAVGTLVSGMFDGVPMDAVKDADFPLVNGIRKTVRAQPAVTAWYDNLPETSMPASYGPF